MCSGWAFYCRLLLVVLAFQQLKAECNMCAVDSNAACISGTLYQQCTNGLPQGKIYECNVGQKCSIQGKCEPEDTIDEVACENCGECNSDKTFACIGTNTFSLCLGSDNATEITGNCGGKYVCNINNPNICGTAEEGYPATCPNPPTEAPVTTPSPQTKPKEYCATIQDEGRFPVGTNPATTCKEFVRCYKTSSDEWTGVLYVCPGATYFSSTTRACSKDLPPRCGTKVASLALYNIQLI